MPRKILYKHHLDNTDPKIENKNHLLWTTKLLLKNPMGYYFLFLFCGDTWKWVAPFKLSAATIVMDLSSYFLFY